MYTTAELQEYVNEIREHVCTGCVERPPGGPPCAPLGKKCGAETHLTLILNAVHRVESHPIERCLDDIRHRVCPNCANCGCDGCPCPLDSLAVVIVQAIERVDRRRESTTAANTERNGPVLARIKGHTTEVFARIEVPNDPTQGNR